MHLLDLPSETLEDILGHTDPLDVAAFAQASRFAHLLVYHSPDQHLWRILYLTEPLDDPRLCISLSSGKPAPTPPNIEWRGDLRRIIRARTVMRNPTVCRPDERPAVLRTLLDIVRIVPPLPSPSWNIHWVAAEMQNGRFLDYLDQERQPERDKDEDQLLAQLHTYFGVTGMDRQLLRRVASRAYVYSMRNCASANHFGPFMPIHDNDNPPSFRINWVHVQAIHHAVSMHIIDDDHIIPFPMSLPFTQPVLLPHGDLDWAGLTGVWRCSFCFCSHQELLDYNDGSVPSTEPLDDTLFWNPGFLEAFRWLDIKIQVTDTKPDPAHPTRPIIEFVGTVVVGTVMRGYVRMTGDNEVRWHSVSEEAGTPVWQCEGVQVGGVGSAFGVLGQWTTAHHERDDPIGPFWLHKISLILE